MKISTLGISLLAGAFFLQSCSIQVVVKNDLPLKEEVKVAKEEHQQDHKMIFIIMLMVVG